MTSPLPKWPTFMRFWQPNNVVKSLRRLESPTNELPRGSSIKARGRQKGTKPPCGTLRACDFIIVAFRSRESVPRERTFAEQKATKFRAGTTAPLEYVDQCLHSNFYSIQRQRILR